MRIPETEIKGEDRAYSAKFLTEFVAGLRVLAGSHSSLKEAIPDPKERIDKVTGLFLELRPKDQPDFWMQPFLLLDENEAILLFKDGPNHLRYGSRHAGYRIRSEDPLSHETGEALLEKFRVDSSHFLERLQQEERLYLAMRSMDHSEDVGVFEAGAQKMILIESNYRRFRQSGSFKTSEEFDRVFQTVVRLRIEAAQDFHRVREVGHIRSRQQKMMRSDETKEIREHLNQYLRKITEAGKTLREHEKKMDDEIALLRPEDLKDYDFKERWGRYKQILKEEVEMTGSLWAFANHKVPAWGRKHTLRELLDLISEISSSSQIKKELPPPEKQEETTVPGNYRFLSFAVKNALLGAWRVSSGKEVTFKVEIEEEAIRLIITDPGPGIAPENLQKISDPDYTTKAGETGHAVTRRVVMEDHGGEVKIDSVLGKGTTVTITWPREERLEKYLRAHEHLRSVALRSEVRERRGRLRGGNAGFVGPEGRAQWPRFRLLPPVRKEIERLDPSVHSIPVNPEREPKEESAQKGSSDKVGRSKTLRAYKASDHQRRRRPSQQVNTRFLHRVPLLRIQQGLKPPQPNTNVIHPQASETQGERYSNIPKENGNVELRMKSEELEELREEQIQQRQQRGQANRFREEISLRRAAIEVAIVAGGILGLAASPGARERILRIVAQRLLPTLPAAAPVRDPVRVRPPVRLDARKPKAVRNLRAAPVDDDLLGGLLAGVTGRFVNSSA